MTGPAVSTRLSRRVHFAAETLTWECWEVLSAALIRWLSSVVGGLITWIWEAMSEWETEGVITKLGPEEPFTAKREESGAAAALGLVCRQWLQLRRCQDFGFEGPHCAPSVKVVFNALNSTRRSGRKLKQSS